MGDDSAVASSAVLSFRRASPLLTILTMTLVALTGCSSGPRLGSELRMGGDPGEICVPAAAGDRIVVGDVVQLATGAAPKTLLRAEIIDAVGIELVESAILPIASDGVAVMSMSLDAPALNWNDRVDVEGWIVDDSPANVVMVLQRTGPEDGKAAAIRVIYDDSGVERFAESTTAIVLADSCGQ